MKTEKLITIKEHTLNNHCPECYNKTGLQLVFKQKFVETSWYRAITKDTAFEMSCSTCNTVIYPARWTDDIERVFDYHQKALRPKRTSVKLKRLGWFVVIFALIALVAAILVPLL